MTPLAHISRVFAVLFALLALFWLALPFLNVLGGTYEGGVMVITCVFFAALFSVVAAALYGCYRYARSDTRSPVLRGFVWAFVTLTGLGGSALAARIFWVTVPAFTR
jgi:hypothetical protein